MSYQYQISLGGVTIWSQNNPRALLSSPAAELIMSKPGWRLKIGVYEPLPGPCVITSVEVYGARGVCVQLSSNRLTEEEIKKIREWARADREAKKE